MPRSPAVTANATRTIAALFVFLTAARLPASGPIGIYGIVEKVVFEPNERSPERIQVWGAFAYVDGGASNGLAVSTVKRGYLYFRLPSPDIANARDVDVIKKEWADLKAVAGTGQAIAFGSWGYIGSFAGLQPQARSSMPPYILERAPGGGAQTDLRVRPASEAPTAPAAYQTETGIVKLSDRGSHAAIVKQLKDGLKQ
jgi:hypothetical protein